MCVYVYMPIYQSVFIYLFVIQIYIQYKMYVVYEKTCLFYSPLIRMSKSFPQNYYYYAELYKPRRDGPRRTPARAHGGTRWRRRAGARGGCSGAM